MSDLYLIKRYIEMYLKLLDIILLNDNTAEYQILDKIQALAEQNPVSLTEVIEYFNQSIADLQISAARGESERLNLNNKTVDTMLDSILFLLQTQQKHTTLIENVRTELTAHKAEHEER